MCIGLHRVLGCPKLRVPFLESIMGSHYLGKLPENKEILDLVCSISPPRMETKMFSA